MSLSSRRMSLARGEGRDFDPQQVFSPHKGIISASFPLSSQVPESPVEMTHRQRIKKENEVLENIMYNIAIPSLGDHVDLDR